MIYGSLFSGAGGFDLGLDAAGMTCAFQCEIDKQARAVLRHRWPEVPKHDDVRELTGRTLPRIDLLVGGFPCQDVSVAGNRAGLAGKRTGLFYEFTRLASELAPEWILLENVPGLLSSEGGRDMGAVLWALGELGYGWAYRSLDAQYFGVPQRRERLFIVGRAGGRSPVEVLFEPDSVPGNPPPRREAREGVAGTLGGGSGARGWAPDTDRMTFVARPLTAPIVGALAANMGQGNQFAMSGQFVAHTLRADGFDASEDGTGRGTPLVADTLRSHPRPGSNSVGALAFDWYASSDQSMPVSGECPPLKGTMQPAVFSDPRRHDENHRGGLREKPSLNTSNNDLVMAAAMGVRRLTPTECERLMSWPDVKKVLHFTACTDHQKNHADADSLSLKSLSFVGIVESSASRASASSADSDSPLNEAPTETVAQWHVEINVETKRVEISNLQHEGSSDVRCVAPRDTCDLLAKDALTALLRAGSSDTEEPDQHRGGAEHPASEISSTRAKNGKRSARKSGRATESVNVVGLDLLGRSTKEMLITSVAGRSSPPCDSQWITLCSSVAHVINGFIQERTPGRTSFDCILTLSHGHTFIGVTDDGKRITMADGPRYRMAGNGVVSNVAAWIGKRVVAA